MANYGGSVWGEFERIAMEKGWNIKKEARFQGNLAGHLQQNINRVAGSFSGYDPSIASIKVDVDRDFGPKSRNAFDHIRDEVLKDSFAKLYGKDRKYFEARSKLLSNDAIVWNDGLVDLIELFSKSGPPAHRYVEMYKKQHEGIGDSYFGKKQESVVEEPFVKDTMPPLPKVDVGGKVPEVDLTKMKRTSSKIVNELISLANDLDAMKSGVAAIAVDKHLANYKTAMDKLYDVFGESGDDLIEMAHPGGGPTIAPSSDEGGKVETIVEEHRKLIDKVNKAPTGKVKESCVNTIAKLIKKANELDAAGHTKAAMIVDKAIIKLQESVYPFVSRSSANEAAGSEDVKASVKETDLKRQLLGYNSMLLYNLGKLQHLIDGFGSEAKKMRKLFEKLRSSMQTLDSNSNIHNYSAIQVAKHLLEITSMITSIEINAKDAFGSLDASSFWEFEKGAQKIHNFIKNMLTTHSSKVENKNNKETLGPQLKKYHSSLKYLKELLDNNKEFVRKFLGNPRLKYEERLKEGHNKVSILTNWIEKELDANYRDPDAWMANRNLWNKIIKPLKDGIEGKNNVVDKKIKTSKDDENPDFMNPPPQTVASKYQNLSKIAAIPFAVNPSGGTSDERGTARAPGRKNIGRGVSKKKSDTDVQNLQRAMMAAGIKIPGSNPDDGVWGKNTYGAYITLKERIESIYPSIKLPEATKEKAPPRLDVAIRAAQYLAKRDAGSLKSDIEIVPGKTIPGESLRSAKEFVNALVLNGIIEDTDHEQENGAQAYDVLADFVQRINSDPDFVERIRISLGDDIKLLKNNVYKLANQLKPFKLVRPKTEDSVKQKDPVMSGGGSPSSKKMDQAILRFNPDDVNSIIAAVNYLDPKAVSSLEYFRNWVPGAYDNPKQKYHQYRRQLAELSAALTKLRPTIEQSPGGSKLYGQLFDKISNFLISLNTTGRQIG